MDADVKNEFEKMNDQMDQMLREMRDGFQKMDERMNRGFRYVVENFATKKDLERFVTKDEFSVLLTTVESLLDEVTGLRGVRLFNEGQMRRFDDKVNDHEKRIAVLEQK